MLVLMENISRMTIDPSMSAMPGGMTPVSFCQRGSTKNRMVSEGTMGLPAHVCMNESGPTRPWTDLWQETSGSTALTPVLMFGCQATVLSALYMGAGPWIGTLFNNAGEDFMCPRP